MANVINRTTFQFLQSVHTPDYPPEVWLIDPDLSNVEDVPQRYWKVVGDEVLPMTQEEVDVLDASTTWYEANHQVTAPLVNGRTVKVEWYEEVDPEAETCTGLAGDRVFSYNRNKLISMTTIEYFKDGSVRSQEVETYWTLPTTGQEITVREIS